MSGRVVRVVVVIAMGVLLAAVAGSPSIVRADTPGSAKEASKHFQRGVALYGEADYRAALVEFRKAYEIAPNATVLYNIGQTYYQLQNYAAALTTLDRYLTEAGAGAAHRGEVEQTLEILQSRVGRISVTANVSGCEIAVDDEHAGRTPLREPILVSIGHRKVTAACEGRSAETRFADIAAGDTAPVQFTLAEQTSPTGPPRPATEVVAKPANWAYRLWVTTVGLGAVALGTGTYAFKTSRDLKSARGENPVQPEDQPAKAKLLSDQASKVKLWATIADVTTVAAIVTGVIAFKLTLSRSTEVRVSLAPGGLQVAGTFR